MSLLSSMCGLGKEDDVSSMSVRLTVSPLRSEKSVGVGQEDQVVYQILASKEK